MSTHEHIHPSGRVYRIAIGNGAGFNRYGLRIMCDRVGETRYVGASTMISAHPTHKEAVLAMKDHEDMLLAKEMATGLHRAPRSVVLAWYDGAPIELRNPDAPSARWVTVYPGVTPDFANPRFEWRVKHVPVVEKHRVCIHLSEYQGSAKIGVRSADANTAGLRGIACTVTVTDGRVTKVESDQTTPA